MENRLFVCGDTHMPYDVKKLSTKNWKEQKELTKDDVLVQLGDFGGIWKPLHLHNKEQDYWLEWLASKKFTTAVVLGNHENYDEIETLPWDKKWGNDVQYWESPKEKNRIYFLKRGAIYEINGRKILTIGGAHSIDKHMRTKGVSWWSQEDISAKEIENCFNELDERGYEVDYVFTHTCPSRLVTEFIHITQYNQGKVKDFTAEFLNEIDNRVTFKEWHFGHMHIDLRYEERNDEGEVVDIYQCHYKKLPWEIE